MAFEKAAVLFNLGAALSADAAAADLATDAGCKRAARRYQVPIQHEPRLFHTGGRTYLA